MMADNGPIVVEPPPEPAAPPTLESLIAEFNRGIGDEFKAATVADMIRQRDNPPEPAAPSSAPEAALAEPAAESPPAPSYRPPYLNDDAIAEQVKVDITAAEAARYSAAISDLSEDGTDTARATEKLQALLLTDDGEKAFRAGGKRWQSAVEKARADLDAEANAMDARRGAQLKTDIIAARAAVRNGGNDPMPAPKFDPVAVSRMSDVEYAAWVQEQARQSPARKR